MGGGLDLFGFWGGWFGENGYVPWVLPGMPGFCCGLGLGLACFGVWMFFGFCDIVWRFEWFCQGFAKVF